MYINLLILAAQTLIFWGAAVVMHRLKSRTTLIPMYVYIALMTIGTHHLADMGFAVIIGNWFFLVASISYFTTLMLCTLILYLFEGPRAGRMALWTILATSIVYIISVYLTGLLADTSKWVVIDRRHLITYLWSITAIVVDMVLLAVLWELFSKLRLPLLLKVFAVFFLVLATDTLIFSTGAFGTSEVYLTMLKGNLMVRLVLSAIGAPVIAYFFYIEGFAESKRERPKNIWQIIDFRSDLETKIESLESSVENYRKLEKQLSYSKETYELVVSGIGAGIWDWDLITGKILLSEKFCKILGCQNNQLDGNIGTLKSLVHADDVENVNRYFNDRIKDGQPIETEFRIKCQDGKFRWFQATGVIKYDGPKPIRAVGSVVDIEDRKSAESQLKNKLDELTELNKVMVGRELKMVELKEKLANQ